MSKQSSGTGDYDQRVTFAASRIASGKRTTRAFNSCFEMDDGDAVALALSLRVSRRPNTKLAANLWRYLDRESVEPLAKLHKARTTPELRALSATLIANNGATHAAT
jgi:hypothetical protein